MSYGAVRPETVETFPDRWPAPLTSPDALARRLQHPGLRAASLALRNHWGGVPMSLILRPWLRIRPWEELRLLIRDGALSRVSQLHLGTAVPRFADVLGRFGERIAAGAHLASFVADVFSPADGEPLLLIETNPWAERTDPCLYDCRHDPPVDRVLRLSRPDGSGGFARLRLVI